MIIKVALILVGSFSVCSFTKYNLWIIIKNICKKKEKGERICVLKAVDVICHLFYYISNTNIICFNFYNNNNNNKKKKKKKKKNRHTERQAVVYCYTVKLEACR